MKFYFVRHGESEANVLGEFSNGLNKHGLTAAGRAQAQALALSLQTKGITRVCASPILRAAQTGEILAGALGCPLEISPALREYDVGVLEGTTGQAGWDLYWQVLEAWLLRGELDRRIPGGESFLDIRARFMPFLDRLAAGSAPENVVLVGHGGTYRCMLPLALRNIDFAFALENQMANTAAVVAETEPGGLVCREWCGAPTPDSAQPGAAARIELVLRFNDALNAGDVDAMMAMMSEDCVFENTSPAPDGERFSGQAAMRAFWEAFMRSSSQPRIHPEAAFAVGDQCVLRWTYTWADDQGRPGRIRGVDVYRFAGDLIAEKLSYVKG